MEKMTVSEFARARGLDRNAVGAYIRRHDEIKKHTETQGKNILLDEEAVSALERKYPLPKPVEIVEDKEARKNLDEAKSMIIALQAKLSEYSGKVMLLEDREKQLKERDEAIASQSAKIDGLQARTIEVERENASIAKDLENAQKRAQEMEEENARLRKSINEHNSGGFFSRLRRILVED